MDKMFSDLALLPNKIEKKKKHFIKLLSELECCIDFYTNKMFRTDCCLLKKNLEIADIIRSCKNKR